MTNKIRVASLTNGMGIGGTAREIITMNKNLNKEFFSHFVISMGSKDDPRSKSIDSDKIFFISDPKEIAQTLKDNNIDVVYTHRHGRNEPAHDAVAKEIGDSISLLEMNTFSVLDKGYFGQRCDKHVFVSQTNLVKYCVQNKIKFDFKKLKTVYGLVNCEHWQENMPTEAEIKDYKMKLGLEGSFVIGRAARPVMEKWDDEMLVMWKRLCKMNPKIKFLIYGVPEERKNLLIAAGTPENLIMLDMTSSDKELGLFYSAIDVFVHDSHIGECSCSTIAEAMFFKKPVVVKSTPFPRFTLGKSHTKDNGQIEQIKNGVNGYVVESGAAMAKAVDYLYHHLEEVARMGEKNHTEVLEKYDARIGIKTFEKIFIESALDKKIELSPNILAYYASNNFFPDENSIKSWFEEYYRRLEDIYGKEYPDSILEKIWLCYLKYKRKSQTLLKKIL
ncbi:MAG: Glycosyl transferase group 1 [Parcubacteria group bacterium Gr01-1014_13]|nr:MAG: Glycosyl transferase group 1 [Parcubacteria group bacterium Gr01-1014_13]